VSFDPISLRRDLDQLSRLHRVAFAATCCERLLPNYAAFSREVHWGEPAMLRGAVDYIWDVLGGGPLDRAEVDRLIERCDIVIPDTENFDTSAVSAALDAGTAVTETLRSLLDGDTDRVVDIASVCRDTVDMYIQDRDQMNYNNDPSFEQKIAQDPLMTLELARQSAILSELMGAPALNSALLQRLREKSADGGRSNIGRTAHDEFG
jgi:uncharacterized protein YjaG (DUF416 family)